ncbi:MAG: LysM peptidoglycan-binding domain-containing protein [Bacteroidota bacterium]|nr:LysM peptidoglycan-binding domain-containing protein [Bacteroidota bacterium]
MNKYFVILFFFLTCFSQSFGQKITAQQYVQQYKDLAIREMKRMGVPAAITLAQGLLETESGNSDLLMRSNNHFGIKCKSTWNASSVTHDDDAAGECFRVYKNAEDSYRDHSNFLRGNNRYAFLFKLNPTDYKGWAYGLRKAGYATNPNYPNILIKNIEDNNLQQYTMEAEGNVPVFDASKYTDDPEDKATTDAGNSSGANSATNQQPSKITINGSRALFVDKGTSLLAIASQNNINLSKLLEINDLNKDGLLEKDQYIFLEKKPKEGNRDFYIVESGETLYDAAQKNGIQLQSLCDYNKLFANTELKTGTRLFLKPQINNTSTTTPNNTSTTTPNLKHDSSNIRPQTHEVQPREGLYSISKKYGVSVQQLKDWNNLQNDNLKIGQQLIISK